MKSYNMKIFSKFKVIIEPLQMWLLSNGRCVGCGKELNKMPIKKSNNINEHIVICECRRTYVYSKKKKVYRRALLKEIK